MQDNIFGNMLIVKSFGNLSLIMLANVVLIKKHVVVYGFLYI